MFYDVLTAADIGPEQVPAIIPSTATLLPASSDINIVTESKDGNFFHDSNFVCDCDLWW